MRRALIIGIDDYPGSPLKGCVNDATRIAQLLETHGDGSPNFSVKQLTSPPESVNRPKLRQAIEELFAGDCDLALFYFSGHGILGSTGGFIVTPDFSKYDEGVAMDDILKFANGSKAKDKVLILDCCHSGALGSPSIIGSNAAYLTEGLTVLTACRDYEKAVEISGTGLYTELILEALQGGGSDLRGHITPGGIYSYVDRALGAWDQRPIFKTNVSRFTSLRRVTPPIPLETLRKIGDYFSGPSIEHKLDPSYEFTSSNPDPVKVAILKDLQKFERVGLVVPVDEEHMYFAAMNSKSCRLTAYGNHYWHLVKDKKV